MTLLKTLSLTQLVDLLSDQTSTYINMLNAGIPKEQIDACREMIDHIQLEIETRKSAKEEDQKDTPGNDEAADGQRPFC